MPRFNKICQKKKNIEIYSNNISVGYILSFTSLNKFKFKFKFLAPLSVYTSDDNQPGIFKFLDVIFLKNICINQRSNGCF